MKQAPNNSNRGWVSKVPNFKIHCEVYMSYLTVQDIAESYNQNNRIKQNVMPKSQHS